MGETFTGWLGHDPKSAQGNMRWEPFTPKPFTDNDVDIKISHCGICGFVVIFAPIINYN